MIALVASGFTRGSMSARDLRPEVVEEPSVRAAGLRAVQVKGRKPWGCDGTLSRSGPWRTAGAGAWVAPRGAREGESETQTGRERKW